MARVNLSALDLNLLVVLDALLAEHSVSRAAKRLGSTQPAVSRALARLRTLFGDPLLTRTRSGMVPTAAALAVAGELRETIERIERLLDRRDAFEAATSRRVFRLTMSEYSQFCVCPLLLRRTLAVAPHVSLDVQPWSLAFPEALETGELDLAVSPPITRGSGLRASELVTDDLVVLVRKEHPAAAEELTLARYASLTHVVSAPNGRAGSVLDDLLEAAGHRRRVVARVPSAVVAPAIVAESDCCATVPARLASQVARIWGLAVLPLPLDAPAIGLDLIWHDRAHHDPGNVWLRGELRALFAPRRRARDVSRLDLARRSRRTL